MSILISKDTPGTQLNTLFCFITTLMAALAYTPLRSPMPSPRQDESVEISSQNKKCIQACYKSEVQPSKALNIKPLIMQTNFIPFLSKSSCQQNMSSLYNNNRKSFEKITDSKYLNENSELDSQTLEQISMVRYEMYNTSVLSSTKDLEYLFSMQALDHKWDSSVKDLDCKCNSTYVELQPAMNISNEIQNGICNVAVTIVICMENKSDILQNGNYNKAQVKQAGTEQELFQLQLGDLNHTDDWQEGSTNRIHVTQSGKLNYPFSTQYGADNELRVIQSK